MQESARTKETKLMLTLKRGRPLPALAAKESLSHFFFDISTDARRRTQGAVAGVYALREMWPIRPWWRIAARRRLRYRILCEYVCPSGGRSALLHTSAVQARPYFAVEAASATVTTAVGGATPPGNDPAAVAGRGVPATAHRSASRAAGECVAAAAAGGALTTIAEECVTGAAGEDVTAAADGSVTAAAGARAKAAATAGGCVTAGSGHTAARTSAAPFELAGARIAVAAAEGQQGEAAGCVTGGNVGSNDVAADLANVVGAAAVPRAPAGERDKTQEKRKAPLKEGQILADREGRGGDSEMHMEKTSGRQQETAAEVFAIAWEGVAGQRRQTPEFLETCRVGFQAVAAKLLRQLQAASEACQCLASAPVSSSVLASCSPSAALSAGLLSSKAATAAQPSPDAAAAGTFSLDAVVAPPPAVPADTRAAAAADTRTHHNNPEEVGSLVGDTKGDTVERPSFEAIPVLFQDLACAHLLSAALQLRCPSLQQVLHAATAAATSLALHASAASLVAPDTGGAAAAGELGLNNTGMLVQRSGRLQRRRRRHNTAAAEATPGIVEEPCWNKHQEGTAGEFSHQQAEAPTDCVNGEDTLSPTFSTDRHGGRAASAVAARGQPSATDVDASGAAAQAQPEAPDVDNTEAIRPRGAAHSGSTKTAASTQTSNLAADMGTVAAADCGSAGAAEAVSPISSSGDARTEAGGFVETAAVIVTAEETALLLRCLGCGGELGTHTSSYLSQLFSFCFRTQNGQTKRANSRSIRHGNVEPPPVKHSTKYGLGEPATGPHDYTTEGVACTSTHAAPADGSPETKKGEPPPTETTNDAEDEMFIARSEAGRRRGRKKARGIQNMSFSTNRQHSQDLLDSSTMHSQSQVAINLVNALVQWVRAKQTTSSSITNALQGYAWITCRRGVVAALDWKALDILLSPLLLPTAAAALSVQQCMDIFEALLLFDCRSTLPRACLVVEALSTELLLREKARKGTDGGSSSTFSALQLLLWTVVLAKYRIEDDAVFSLAADVLRQQQSQQMAHPALIAACAYAFGKFYGSSRQAIVLESMVVLARQLLHRFQLGDLSQLLISLTRADVSDSVLFARSAVKIKRNIAAILEGGEDAVAAWWRADPAVSAQQLVNLCLAFARQRVRDEKLFRGIAQLLLCLPPSQKDVPYHVNGNKKPLSWALGLSCLTCRDTVNLVVAFSRVRILEQNLFQGIDELLTQHLLSDLLMSPELILETLVAHSKLAYRSPRLHHCLLLALAKCCCRGTSLKLSVRDRLRLVQAVDDLGLPLLPLLKKSVQKGVPAQLLRGTSAGDLSCESYAEEQVGINSVPAWRRGSNISRRRKRQKARKRKWTW